MKLASNVYALVALFVSNLVPLYGVIFWGWNVFSLMVVYWLESAIIGFFTIRKMMKAEGASTNPQAARHPFGAKLFYIPFFSMHYGLFMFVHLIFIFAFFFSRDVSWGGVIVAFLSLFMSHFVSYQSNFVNKKEYLLLSPDDLFMRPYPRILVMHLTVLLGGGVALSTGQAVWALTLMVTLKTIADLGSHLFEHYQIKKFSLVTSSL